jgi:hypothetical protein
VAHLGVELEPGSADEQARLDARGTADGKAETGRTTFSELPSPLPPLQVTARAAPPTNPPA